MSFLPALSLIGALLAQDPDQDRPRVEAFGRLPSTIAEALPPMVETMRRGIGQQSPSGSIWRRGPDSIFDGSFDWHSCIAAHWALLAYARIARDPSLEEELLDRLQPAALEAEMELFRSTGRRRMFFMPYADGWFAMLLAELARRDGSEALRALRNENEDRLLDWLEQGEFPERVIPSARGGLPYAGFYRSWLFGYLLLEWSGPERASIRDRLERLRAERLEPQRSGLRAQTELQTIDFLFLPAVEALDHVITFGALPEAYAHPATVELPDSVTIRSVHVVGAAASRTWPYALAGGRGDPKAAAAFAAGMSGILSRTDLWREDFATVSHWVPQFLWLGVWLALDRP